MLLNICWLLLALNMFLFIVSIKIDSYNLYMTSIIMIMLDIVLGFFLLCTLFPVKCENDENIYPINVYKTNFETVVTYKVSSNSDIRVISSSDAKIFCSTNDITIKANYQYNSYNQRISSIYTLSTK